MVDRHLAMGERALAAATVTGGGWAVATTASLWIFEEGGGTERWGWDEIDRAVWGQDGLLVTRLAAGELGRRLRFDDPGRVPEVVRERVTSSILLSEAHRLPTGGRVRVVARRRPGAGEPKWYCVFERPEDARDPDCRAEADRLRAEAAARFAE